MCGLSVSYWEKSADKHGGKYSQISLLLNIEAPDFLGYHCSNLTALQISLKRLGTYGNSPTFLITFFFSKDIKRSMLLYSKMLKIHRFLFDATNGGIILVKESPRNWSSQFYSVNHFSILPHNFPHVINDHLKKKKANDASQTILMWFMGKEMLKQRALCQRNRSLPCPQLGLRGSGSKRSTGRVPFPPDLSPGHTSRSSC